MFLLTHRKSVNKILEKKKFLKIVKAYLSRGLFQKKSLSPCSNKV